jgi:hypothetical protein
MESLASVMAQIMTLVPELQKGLTRAYSTCRRGCA